MRAGRALGLVLIAPAAVAAATLAVFLGTGLLIVVAGTSPAHRRPMPRVVHHLRAPGARRTRAGGGHVRVP